jgi:hypothetical protein
MTQREFYQAVINANVNAELCAYATNAIEKLDKRNAVRASKPTKSQKANEEFKAQIIEFLTGKEDYTLCSEIAEHFEVKTQKASGVLGLMIKDGTVEVADIKVKGGKRKGYKLRAM